MTAPSALRLDAQDLPRFPDPRGADARGLVALTDGLSPRLLLAAYRQGLFPWTDAPVGWFCPDPRALVERAHLHLPRNLPKLARRGRLRASFDQAFAAVILGCAQAHAADGVWITPAFRAAYTELHAAGWAHSVEIWRDDQLVGGLYGVQPAPGLFAAESMFGLVDDASKVAFAALWAQLDALGIPWLDVQVANPHTLRLGAREVPRDAFLRRLAARLPPGPPRTPPPAWPAEPPAWQGLG